MNMRNSFRNQNTGLHLAALNCFACLCVGAHSKKYQQKDEVSFPLQVVVGSFIADGRKESKSASQVEPSSAPPKIAPVGGGGGVTGTSSPPSRGTLSESSGGPGSPLNQSTGACNNSNPPGMTSIPWK